MKKIIKILAISIYIILVVTNFTFATANIQTALSDVKKTENEIDILLEVNNMNEIGDGINACMGTFIFDTNYYEFVKLEEKNGWGAPIYNEKLLTEGKVKFTTSRGDYVKEKNKIVILTLKEKQENKSVVKIEDFMVAAKINGKKEKVTANNVSIKLGSVVATDNITKNDEATDNIPNAGKTKILKVIISISIVIIIIIFIKYKTFKDVK